MIVVTVDLVSANGPSRDRQLAQLHICNTGDGTRTRRNYTVRVFRPSGKPASDAWCEFEPEDLSQRVIEVISLRRDQHEWWALLSPKPIVISSFKTYGVPPSKDHIQNFETYLLGDMTTCVMGTIALSASCFKTTEVIIPTKLQNARSRSGRPILYDFKVVQLSANTAIRRPTVGTHSSPMLHWRRGHYRRLSNSGKLVPVSPCLVGDAANGISDKIGYNARNMIKETFGK